MDFGGPLARIVPLTLMLNDHHRDKDHLNLDVTEPGWGQTIEALFWLTENVRMLAAVTSPNQVVFINAYL